MHSSARIPVLFLRSYWASLELETAVGSSGPVAAVLDTQGLPRTIFSYSGITLLTQAMESTYDRLK